MFQDLPLDIQQSITRHLNQKDFVGAKRIYDQYHQHQKVLSESPQLCHE